MREIKFRAWSKQLDRMVQPGFYLRNCDNHIFYETEDGDQQEYTPEDITLMQYTGLHDKNNKEIYEGDIVSGITERIIKDNEWVWEVSKPKEIKFKVRESDFDGGDLWGMSGFTPLGHGSRDRVEVIGNIYENKDLLDG